MDLNNVKKLFNFFVIIILILIFVNNSNICTKFNIKFINNNMEYISQIINTTINSFDFTYCLIVNLLTYFVIKIIDELNKNKEVKTWIKRVVLIVCILLTGIVYYITGQDVRLLFNSAILAPVAWSWIFRPIFKKLGIGYKEIDNTINK